MVVSRIPSSQASWDQFEFLCLFWGKMMDIHVEFDCLDPFQSSFRLDFRTENAIVTMMDVCLRREISEWHPIDPPIQYFSVIFDTIDHGINEFGLGLR